MASRSLLIAVLGLVFTGGTCDSPSKPPEDDADQFTASISSPGSDPFCLESGNTVKCEAEVLGGRAESEFLWTVTGGATFENPTDKIAGDLSFPGPGDYTIVFQAKPRAGDAFQEIGTRLVKVRENCSLELQIASPPNESTFDQGAPITFQASIENNDEEVTLTWTWGDGGTDPSDPGVLDATHAYAEAGSYSVSVSAADASCRSGSADILIEIIEVALGVDIDAPENDDRVTLGESVGFSGRVFGGCPPYEVTWVFVDGTESTQTVDAPGTVTATHTYGPVADPDGKVTVKLKVKDSKGNEQQSSIRLFVTDGVTGIASNVNNPRRFARLPDRFGDQSLPDDRVLILGYDAVGVFNFTIEGWDDRILEGVDADGMLGISVDCPVCTPPGPVEAAVWFDFNAVNTNPWNGTSFGPTVPLQPPVGGGADVVGYGGDPTAKGFILVAPSFIGKYALDEATREFALGDSWITNAFPERTGLLRSAFARSEDGSFLAISDGSPSQLYLHDGQAGSSATKISDIGNGGRRVRALGEVFVVTTQFDDDILVGTWTEGDLVTITEPAIDVGGATTEVDMKLLPNGNIGIVTTPGGNVVVTQVDSSGGFVGNTTIPLPGRCSGALGAIWYPGESTKVLVPCESADAVFPVETGL